MTRTTQMWEGLGQGSADYGGQWTKSVSSPVLYIKLYWNRTAEPCSLVYALPLVVFHYNDRAE